jgi:hypothetical protein
MAPNGHVAAVHPGIAAAAAAAAAVAVAAATRPSEYLELFYPVLRAQGELVSNGLNALLAWYMLDIWYERDLRSCPARC